MPISLLTVGERQVADLFISPLEGVIDAELFDAPLSPAPSGTVVIVVTTSGNPTRTPVVSSASGTVAVIVTTTGAPTVAGVVGNVAFAAVGTVAGGSGTATLPVPAGTAGQGLLAILAWGNASDIEPVTPAGWVRVGASVGGPAGASGEDTGHRGLSVFWRVADNTETNCVVTMGGSAGDVTRTSAGAVTRYASGLGYFQDPVLVFADDAVADTNYSATAATDPGGVSGDHAVAGFGLIPGANTGAPTLTWAGSTGLLSRVAGQITTGGNVRVAVASRDVTASTTAGPVLAYSAIVAGPSVLVRLRGTATAAPMAPVPNAGATITAQEPWVSFALDGSASYDPNAGDTLTPLWTLTSGNPAEVAIVDPNALVTSATVSPKTVENLTYVFTLKVTDPGGLNTSATKTVTVLRASESTPRDGVDVPIRITSA